MRPRRSPPCSFPWSDPRAFRQPVRAASRAATTHAARSWRDGSCPLDGRIEAESWRNERLPPAGRAWIRRPRRVLPAGRSSRDRLGCTEWPATGLGRLPKHAAAGLQSEVPAPPIARTSQPSLVPQRPLATLLRRPRGSGRRALPGGAGALLLRRDCERPSVQSARARRVPTRCGVGDSSLPVDLGLAAAASEAAIAQPRSGDRSSCWHRSSEGREGAWQERDGDGTAGRRFMAHRVRAARRRRQRSSPDVRPVRGAGSVSPRPAVARPQPLGGVVDGSRQQGLVHLPPPRGSVGRRDALPRAGGLAPEARWRLRRPADAPGWTGLRALRPLPHPALRGFERSGLQVLAGLGGHASDDVIT